MAVLAKQGRFVVAEPLFDRGRRVTLDSRALAGARVGDLALLGVGKRGVRVVRSLGRPHVARDVLEALMLDRGLRRSFGRAVEAEASERAEEGLAAAGGASPGTEGRAGGASPAAGGLADGAAPGAGARADGAPRHDLTDLPTFTVDPADAKDFDDAISARVEDDGATRVWVHIADVSAYVRAGRPLEQETFRRATSVYLPGAVEPMLPEALSNRACSLVPGAARLAVSVEMEMRGAGVASVRFHRSVIRSDARLDYDRVDRVLRGSERAEGPWAEPLAAARAVAAALTERRSERGSLAVESSEPVFDIDSEGHVAGVRHAAADRGAPPDRGADDPRQRAGGRVPGGPADAHPLPGARAPDRPGWSSSWSSSRPRRSHPAASRAHEPAAGRRPRRRRPAGSWRSRSRRTGRGRAALTSLVLRSLKQAFYSPRNLGHAGLASPRYCHFTSPIRRYPDLVAHRALLAALGMDDAAPRGDELDEAGLHSSAAERDALQVERDADDVCLAFLLQRRLLEDGWESRLRGRGGGPDRCRRLPALRRARASRGSSRRGGCTTGGS